MVQTVTIEESIHFSPESTIFVDTRSPKEFELDHIPNAINIPIFSNDERKVIGTLYKQNQVKAYQEGFSIYNKKISDFIKQFEAIDSHKQIIVYCWRGGMRSKTIAELVSSLGRSTLQLIGGYKSYRAFIREELRKPIPFEIVVLQGMAGCGKTDLIKKLDSSLDLEGLAKHRSSLFGAIGLVPVNQKQFETALWCRLNELKNASVVFVEGEAKKIGDVFVPASLFEAMRKAPTVLVSCSIESRSKRIVRDYFSFGADKEIKRIISLLKVALSNQVVSELQAAVDRKGYEFVAKVLLEKYYDVQYSYALKTKKYDSEISSEDLDKAVLELTNRYL